MKYDYEDGDLKVTLKDTGVPTGGRWMATIELWLKDNEHPTFQYYTYGAHKGEALDNAKQWIAEYRAEIR